MALFKFVDLRKATAAPSADLSDVLDLQPGEPLIGRRLRGVGMWDTGRELFEIVMPRRLPCELDYTVDDDLYGLLDRQAPDFRYGEAHPESLRRRLRADETVILTRPVPGLGPMPSLTAIQEDWAGVPDPQPIGMLVFFPQPSGWRSISRAWRYADRLIRQAVAPGASPLDQGST